MLRISDRYWAGKSRLLRLLEDLEASSRVRRTVFLPPDPPKSRHGERSSRRGDPVDARLDAVLEVVGSSETGLAVFVGEDRTVVVAPPFPLEEDARAEGALTSPLVELLATEPLTGVVLLRLGRYAVGVLRGGALVASKTGSRYVKSRHRAGGSSQRRFERSRERLIRELFDKACEVARNVLSPYDLDYLLMGGERNVLRGLLLRCRYLQSLEGKTLGRRLQVDRPGQAALEGIAGEVWKSRVFVLTESDEGHQG